MKSKQFQLLVAKEINEFKYRCQATERISYASVNDMTAPISQCVVQEVSTPLPSNIPAYKFQKHYTKSNTAVSLADLLCLSDDAFIDACFKVLLNRVPDHVGMGYYLNKLRKGELDKIAIITRLRFSKEGLFAKSKLSGGTLTMLISAITQLPIIGYFLKSFRVLFTLPSLIRQVRQFEAHQMALQTQLKGYFKDSFSSQQNDLTAQGEYLVDMLRVIEDKLNQIEKLNINDLSNLKETITNMGLEVSNSLSAQNDKFDAEINNVKLKTSNDLLDLEVKIDHDSSDVTNSSLNLNEKFDAEINNIKLKTCNDLLDLEVKIDKVSLGLSASLLNLDEKFDTEINNVKLKTSKDLSVLEVQIDQASIETSNSFLGLAEEIRQANGDYGINIDEFYFEFENHFRGARDVIKNRQTVYLPIISEKTAPLNEFPFLDVGCGRGEWLEVLHQSGIKCYGVDMNKFSIDECRAHGLNVTHQDAFDFLKASASECYRGVSSFHLIEHIPLQLLLTLVDECYRVLVTGGIIILETPNPSNLIVGAHTFYTDPTHKNPLPPALMKFVLEQRGFCNVSVLPLHPYPEEIQLKSSTNSELLNDLLFGSQDYSVIGIKP
jgi:O-antigen chain-terminating methyltransferase